MAKDMTVGSPGKTLFLFAVPMVLGNIFQQFYNIVDSMVVGNFIGEKALAAVGASASITFLFIALATGLSIGAAVVISQYFGAGMLSEMKTGIYTILFFSGALSVCFSVIGVAANRIILSFMQTPDDIMEQASSYLMIYFAGLLFLFMYNTLNAIFNALGSSQVPFLFLVLSSIVNVGLDLFFVISLGMGVVGVAYATLIAQALSAVLSFIFLMHRLRKMQIGSGWKYFDYQILKTICTIAIPSIIQQSIVSVGIVLVQALVNGYGSVVVAGFAAATKIDQVAIMPMVNVGSAISTFVAQNIGAGKIDRIRKGVRAGLLMSSGIAIAVSLALVLWGEVFIRAFVNDQCDPEVIEVGMSYLRVVGLSYILMGTMNLYNGVLRGAGDMKVFLICSLLNLSTRVIVAYLFAGLFGKEMIWYSITIGWAIGLIVAYSRYRSGRWKNRKVV